MRGLITIEEVAKRTGYTKGTAYNYVSWGILPPPTMRVGTAMFFAPDDIKFFLQTEKRRTRARKKRRTR